MSLSHDVATYVNGLNGCRNARPVKVTIGEETFEGALYEHDGNWGHGAPDYQRRFYLVGEVSEVFRKGGKIRHGKNKIVFTFDGAEWYSGGGYTPYLLKPWGKADFINKFGGGDLRPYYPFGYMHDISEWPARYGKMDKLRQRVPMGVEFL